MTGHPVPIPPDGTLREQIRVDRMAHGFDVVIAVRMLRLPEELEDDHAMLLTAWLGLTKLMERRGVDTQAALRTMPRLK